MRENEYQGGTMKIVQVKIKNFRSYKDEVKVDFGSLTAFVGKNDVGKSTILEALDVFFGGGVIKLDKNDVNKICAKNEDLNIQIAVVFDNFPQEIILDDSNPTNLRDEYLLNKDGKLEIIKKYSNAGKERVFIRAHHPSYEKCSDLHHKKISDLQKIVKDENIPCDNKAKSAELRKAIWSHYFETLEPKELEIEVNKEDAKNIWEKLEKSLPHYALFQSDRSNNDGDNEIKNPLQIAVSQIFKEEQTQKELQSIAKRVIEELEKITHLTLEKLQEMNPDVAKSLKPEIPSPSDLKWADVFKKVSITGDEDIPINKRGSGVKRLILLNFFRAEAERQQNNEEKKNLVYAIEEPETSQHQEHQRILIDSLIELSKKQGIQVVLTTHSPTIVKRLDFENLRVIKNSEKGKEIVNIQEARLPFPSLNEVNFLAFGEANEEYHNELYGFLETKEWLNEYEKGKDTREYIKKSKREKVTLTRYIRHQIHHPENKLNTRYTNEELQESIRMMREFIAQRRIDNEEL